jgi:hypothetical protein
MSSDDVRREIALFAPQSVSFSEVAHLMPATHPRMYLMCWVSSGEFMI